MRLRNQHCPSRVRRTKIGAAIFAMQETEQIVLDSSSVIANGKNLCRINVCDWNKDGFNDYLIGEIGATIVSDFKLGCVSLLIGKPDGSVDRHVIAEDLARTGEAVPFDYDEDGDLDVLVAEFGWNRSGGFRLLRNQTPPNTPADALRFNEEILDPRHGILAIQIADMDGDSRMDIVTAYGQEYEMVEILFNRAPGEYEKKVIARMPDPSYNSSAILVSDLDGDGNLDVKCTYDSVCWWEQKENLEFVRHSIERDHCLHATCTAADVDGDGRIDLVVGELADKNAKGALRVFWNRQRL